MPKWGYSSLKIDEEGIAKASGRDVRVSPKAAREICRAVRKMRLDEARTYLEEVIEKKRPIPYRRHSKHVSHKAGIQRWYAGRFPVKAAREFLKIMDSLYANAESRGLDTENLKIIHAAAQKGRSIKRFIPRAFGSSSPRNDHLCHIELAVKER